MYVHTQDWLCLDSGSEGRVGPACSKRRGKTQRRNDEGSPLLRTTTTSCMVELALTLSGRGSGLSRTH